MPFITDRGRREFLAQERIFSARLAQIREMEANSNDRRLTSWGQGNDYAGDRNAAEDEEHVLIQRLQQVRTTLSTCEVCLDPKGRNRIQIGHIVKARRSDPGREENEVFTFQIVGMNEGDAPSDPARYSYLSPFARAFIGRAVDDEVVVNSAGGTRNYIVTDICLPEPAEEELPLMRLVS